MSIKKFLLSFIFTTSLTLSAFAGTLDTYKTQGLIGETTNGFIAAVQATPSSEVAQFVKKINAERLQKYKGVAASNGLTLKQVQSLAGKKLISQTPAGGWIQRPDGQWVKK